MTAVTASATMPKRIGMTMTEHILSTQPKSSRGEFTLLNMAIMTAIKVIEKKIRRAGLAGNFGYASSAVNATGDDQAKLDVISNDVFKANLVATGHVFIMGSEEEDHGVLVDKEHRGQYVLCFDPLDGSSNIDANVTVGSIWAIWRMDPEKVKVDTKEDVDRALLQPGNKLVAAGYAMYGSATILVMTSGHGVNGFTLDASIGEFIHTHPNMKLGKKKIYSVNEGNTQLWHPWFKEYVDHVKSGKKPYTARYIGSMVGDVHRTILYGGIFCYPDDAKSKEGKLRYLYEAAPMAFLVEQAGGIATTGEGRILDVVPKKLHQRVPVFLGSKEEVELLLSFRAKSGNNKKPASKL
jgi:fructose-1,6-bisphosphatase I